VKKKMLITTSDVILETSSGKMLTYVYEPRSETPIYQEKKYGGIIFFSAIFQRTPGIERMAMRLCAQGYVVIVPEIWHANLPVGTVLNADNEGTAKGNALKKVTKIEDWDNDTQVLVQYLQNHPKCSGRIGAIGHCLGGHLTFRAAFHPSILAAACFFATDIHHGILGVGDKAGSLERVNDIKGELMMFWGRQDPHVPDEGRRKIYIALQESKIKYSWFEYNANHSFLMDNDPKGRYDASVSELCLSTVFDLFTRTI